MSPVVFPRAGGIEAPVVLLDEGVPTLGVPENPLPEFLLDFVLLLLCQGRGLRVQDAGFLAIWPFNSLVYPYGFEVQRFLYYLVGVEVLRAVGCVRPDVPDVFRLVRDVPCGRHRRVGNLDAIRHIRGGLQKLEQERLDVLRVYPRRPEAHVDLRCRQRLGLRLLQGLHVAAEELRFPFGIAPRCLQLLSDVAGQVLVRRLPDRPSGFRLHPVRHLEYRAP